MYMAEELKGIFTKTYGQSWLQALLKGYFETEKDWTIPRWWKCSYRNIEAGDKSPRLIGCQCNKNAIGQAIKIARSRFVEEIVESIDNIKAMVENSEKQLTKAVIMHTIIAGNFKHVYMRW